MRARSGGGVPPGDDLERVAGRRGAQVGAHLDPATGGVLEHGAAQPRLDPRLVAAREQGAHLDAGRAGGERGAQALRRARPARDPERQAQRADLLEVHLVARAVDGVALLVRRLAATRRRVVAAGGGALDDEAVHPAGGLAHQHGREQVAGDDGQEPRADESAGARPPSAGPGPAAGRARLRVAALHVHAQQGGLVQRQRVEAPAGSRAGCPRPSARSPRRRAWRRRAAPGSGAAPWSAG